MGITVTLPITLGAYRFEHLEIPENINGGGMQSLQVHKLIGGARSVNALGPDDNDISWSGLFLGLIALERVRYLDTVRKQGLTIPFTYSEFNYNVIVKSFTYSIEREYQIKYSIALTVVDDLMQPVNFALPAGFDDVLFQALNELLDLATLAKNGGISGAVGALADAMNALGTFAGASQSAINGINALIKAAQSAVGQAINNANNAFG